MGVTWTITRRELGAYFSTPVGYVFVIFFLLISCFFFVSNLFVDGIAEMRTFFGLLPMLYLFFVPAIAMRLWAEERKLGTLELLMTFPIRTWQAVLAKFLAGMIFLGVSLALTAHLPLTLQFFLRPENAPGPDWGPILGGYLGALALGMVYFSAGAFASSLTGDQIVAFVAGFSINAVLFLLAYPPLLGWVKDASPVSGSALAAVVERFGVLYHYDSVSRGVVDSRDIVYALAVTGFFLFLNVLVIERRR
ncbi:MAG: ABC transporter permease [Planctomycetes bacterium]|nr:ABC transporter permease [Planctomycetota bacterium]